MTACATLTVDEESALGRHEQAVLQQRSTLLRDAVVVGYVRRLGADLVKHARPSPFEMRFYVVEDEDLNAFAIPGGSVYVNTGLMLEVSDPSDLAGILAHEIGHVTARHVAAQYRRARNTGLLAQLAALAARLFTRQPELGELLAQVGASVYLNTFTQDAEREADRLAVETLSRSGYDPYGMIRALQMLEAKSRGPRAPSFLSTHPAPPERIRNVRAEIEARVEAGETIGARHRDRGELEAVQRRIRLILGTDGAASGEARCLTEPRKIAHVRVQPRDGARETTARWHARCSGLRRLEQRTDAAEQKAAEAERAAREAQAQAAEAARRSEAIFNRSVRK